MDIEIILAIIIVILALAQVVTLVLLFNKKNKGATSIDTEKIKNETRLLNGEMSQNINNSTSNLLNTFSNSFMENLKSTTQYQNERLDKFNELQTERLLNFKNIQNENLEKLTKTVYQSSEQEEKRFNLLKEEVSKTLETSRKENADAIKLMRFEMDSQLKEVRKLVDEKMAETISERFNQSFKIVTESLNAINKGFGQIHELTSGVTDLKKVLYNVKTRGVLGENTLDNLLEQILTKDQYGCQVNIKGSNAVDFAIYLPGKDNTRTLLPIDAKFPIEDYERIILFSENGEKENLIKAKKDLVRNIKEKAKSIQSKYISSPLTTDFAIMYLPIEGLFAEVVKEPGLSETLQRENHIVIAGPTTITALLNSLQMGFKTLAIQKSSSEIWKMFIQFRKDFAKFTDLLDKTQEKMKQITNTIEDASKRSGLIQKRLSKVETLAIPENLEEAE